MPEKLPCALGECLAKSDPSCLEERREKESFSRKESLAQVSDFGCRLSGVGLSANDMLTYIAF
jgi:hypothetical protein